jgi:tetratricopeptide (TPR) repeat protein
MINIAISIAVALLISLGFIFGLQVTAWVSVPMGVIVGVVAFIFLGRKIQEQLEGIMAQMQRDLTENKLDRAIETLKRGFVLKNRHIFVGSQLNSQIGMLYYIKKEQEKALEHFKKGFVRHYIGQGMMAAIYYKRKDYDTMRKVMDDTLRANKKEAICYALYAYFLYQIKERDKAIEYLQKGLKKLPDDQRLQTNLTQLQNNKKMKMKVFGEVWTQFMLERPPRIQQQQPPHMRMKRRAMFR